MSARLIYGNREISVLPTISRMGGRIVSAAKSKTIFRISTYGSSEERIGGPSRRWMISKVDGKQRPIGIAAIEDKIVQAAVIIIPTPIYEAEFLGFSCGFRP